MGAHVLPQQDLITRLVDGNGDYDGISSGVRKIVETD